MEGKKKHVNTNQKKTRVVKLISDRAGLKQVKLSQRKKGVT